MAFFLDIHVINRKLYSCGIFIDLKKAFDRVDVNIMSLTLATKARKTISIITKTLLLTWWTKIWNSIPENLRKLPKHALKKQILLDLQRQDSYATDTDTFIKEILKR